MDSLCKSVNSLVKNYTLPTRESVKIVDIFVFFRYIISVKFFFKSISRCGMTQEEIKNNFSKNLSTLRKSRNLTQLALAEKLNYSDKAVSKWEVGTVLPDVETMSNIADFFGVTVNDLIYEKKKKRDFAFFRSHIFIALVTIFAVFFAASIVFFVLAVATSLDRVWLSFIVAIPVASIVLIVFSSLWFGRIHLLLSISSLFWGVLLNIYLFLIQYDLWFIFIVGIFGQMIIGCSFLINKFSRKR